MEKKVNEATEEMTAEEMTDDTGVEQEKEDTVTISRSALKQLLLIPTELESADQAYLPCQATVFRFFANALYTAPKTRTAAAEAKKALGEA